MVGRYVWIKTKVKDSDSICATYANMCTYSVYMYICVIIVRVNECTEYTNIIYMCMRVHVGFVWCVYMYM